MSLQAPDIQGVSILDILKSGNITNIDQTVKDFLEPVLKGKIGNIEHYGTFAVHFLHGSFSVISSGNITPGMLDAVEMSYKCFKQARNQVKLSEPLAVPKLLYHIVTKIPANDFQSYVISLCTSLYEELLPFSETKNDMVATIISNTFSRLWNLSVKQEQDGGCSDWQILQLRHIVLKILLLKPGTLNSVVEKFILALTRFEKITVQKHKIIGESGSLVVDLVADLLIAVQDMVLQTEEEELLPFKVIQYLLKFGVQFDVRKSIELSLLSIQTWSNRTFKNSSVIGVLNIFYYCSQQVLQWMKNDNKENSSKKSTFNGKTKLCEGNQHVLISCLPEIVDSMATNCQSFVVEALLELIRFIDRVNFPGDVLHPFFLSFSKIDEILVKWNTAGEKQRKARLEMVQTQMKIIFKYVKGSDGEAFMTWIQLCEVITDVYNTLLLQPVAKDQDRHYCGYVLSKLGQLCSEKELFQQAIMFYTTACEQLKLFVNSENSQKETRLEEVCLGRKYACLAETYMKVDDVSSAMDTLASCVLVDPSNLVQIARSWVRIKKNLIKTDTDDMIKRTLGQAVYQKDKSADLGLLLRAEFDVFKSYRKRYFMAEIEILQQLIGTAEDPLVKGRGLLELGLVYWQSGNKNNLEVEGYLNQCESVVINIQGSEEILGQVYMWQFIIGQENMSQQILSSVNLVIETTKADPGEEADIVVTDSPDVYMTVSKEMEAITLLDKAVALWEDLDEINDVPMFLQSLIICSRQYELLKKKQECLRVIKMYHKIIEKYSFTATTDALCLMIESLLSMDQITEAKNLVQDTDDWDKQIWSENMIYNQIARSHVQMYCQQYKKGISILKNVLDLISPQSKTWTVLMLEGKAKRLMSQLLTFPELSVVEYSLVYATDAVRFHTGVVHFLLGKEFLSFEIVNKKAGNTIDRWTALTEVLSSLLNLGNLYCHIGEAREAKCYLKEGWKIARYFGLPRWNIKFASVMAKLSCMCDKGEDAIKSVQEITEVLPSLKEASKSIATSCITVPECINHVLENNLCNFCHDNMEQILDLVPTISEVFVLQGENKEAMSLLEKAEAVLYKLIWPKSGSKSNGRKSRDGYPGGKTNSLYIEILSCLVELCLPEDVKKCQELLAKGDNLENLDRIPFNVLSRFRLCQSLCSINWQKFVSASSSSDIMGSSGSRDKTVESESSTPDAENDFMNDLPVVNLSKKFERMSVKSVKENNDMLHLTLEKLDESKSRKQSIAFEIEPIQPEEDVTTAPKVKLNSRPKNKRGKSASVTSVDRSAVEGTGEINMDVGENGKVNAEGKTALKANEENDNILPDLRLQTPCKVQPKLMMKTPRSVCSRKAILDKLMDSDDDDDVKPLASTRKTKTTARKGKITQSVKKETGVLQFDDETEQKKSKKSKTARGQKRLFDPETLNMSEKVSKGRSGRSRSKVNNSGTQSGDVEIARLTVEQVDGEELENIDKRSMRGSKIPRLASQSAKNIKNLKNNLPGENNDQSGDVYEFHDEAQPQNKKNNSGTNAKKNVKKVPVTKARRLPRSKVEGTEKTRSDSDSEDEKQFCLDDSVSIKDDESAQSENMERYLFDDSSFTVPIQPDTGEFENVIIQEVTECDDSLNESIETLRGDDKAGKTATRKGRTQKKVSKDDNSEDHTSGETTEVLRSSKLMKRPQMKMEKMVKVEAHQKQDSNTSNTDNQLIQTLEKAYAQSKHLPSPPVFTSICHMLALQYMELCPLKAAFYLAESIAVTFRHQSLINASRKIRKFNKTNEKSESNSMEASDVMDLQKGQDILHFNKTEDDFMSMLSQIPDDWSVCQLSVISQSTPSMLIVSKVDVSGQPIVVQLPGFNSEQGRELLEEFSSIINESRDSMKITSKNEWWKWRRSLDARMQALLENMEKIWLGRWKFLLLGNPVGIDIVQLESTTENIIKMLSDLTDKYINSAVIKALLQSGTTLTEDQLNQILSDMSGHDDVSDIVKVVTQFLSKYTATVVKRHHVILLLDKTLQHLPWENIPILKRHSLSRLPSLYHMINYLSQQKGRASEKGGVTTVNQHNVYYVLNPDNNLPTTQETFQDWFEKLPGWQGIVGKPPTADQYTAALTQYDLLVYCGHGSGSKYLNGDDLQQLQCRAAVFLMGCSSGQLLTKGQLEASGMMLNYFLANCPCIVSNLWDVTDKDIDRFLEHLLQSCLSDKPCDILIEIPSAREACRLPYLIGAAPVVYGFPIVTKNVT